MNSEPDGKNYYSMPRAQNLVLEPQQFRRLRDMLVSYSGFYIDEGRQRLLDNGVSQRLAATGLELDAYLALLGRRDGRHELQTLVELVLNHETLFFRNMPHMRALGGEILPQLHRQKPLGEPLRIWSAGCSTGEEAYSLAIAALETFGPMPTRRIEIIGTDLSEAALNQAKIGRYKGRTLTNLTPRLRERYFKSDGDALLVRNEVRSLVRFERLNLLEPFPAWTKGVDIIFCQNVTIYFQVATCRALMARFYDCLPEGGYLFLGFSETIWHIFNKFVLREIAGSFVYYKDTSIQEPASRGDMRQGVEPGLRPRQTQPLSQRRLGRTPERLPEKPTRSPLPPVTTQSSNTPPVEDGAALISRSRVLLGNGETDRALELLRRLPPDSNYTPEALVLIAHAHADRNELLLALAEVRRALELHPLSGEAHLLLGLLYCRQEQWSLASSQFERARYLDTTAPLPSYYLAEAYRQEARIDAAIREYRSTLEKLAAHPPDMLLNGVTVRLLQETCQRYLQQLTVEKRRGV